jgi:hypothetical protein
MGSKQEDTLKRTDTQIAAMEKGGDYQREINMLYLRVSDKSYNYFIEHGEHKTVHCFPC